MEATYYGSNVEIKYTPSGATTAGQVFKTTDGKAAVAATDIAAGVQGTAYIGGVFKVASASATTFAVGDYVYWDASADLAITTKAADDDFYIGQAFVAKVATELVVQVNLNYPVVLPVFVDDVLLDRTAETVTLAGGSLTLDAEDVGKVMNVTVGHATNAVILPATAAGLEFVVRVGTTGQRVAVSPNSADKIMGPDAAGTNDKDWICAAATSVVGDYVVLRADGTDGYYLIRQRGTWVTE